MATSIQQSCEAQRMFGFDCEFVDKPPKAFQSECPVCLQILCKPYQVSCCGNSFCQVCIKRIKTDKKPCPTCKEKKLTAFHNKGLQCSLYDFQVYCSHKQEGCEWKGELGQLDNHLNLSPQLDKQLKGCEYSEIPCIYCYESIKRSNITVHQNDLCPKRPFSCEYCHSYKSHYEDVIHNHWPVCGYHPVRCPNECGTFPQCQALENHVTRDCPNAVIDCDFHHVGCDVRLPRKNMPAHLKENLVTHLSLQAKTHKELDRGQRQASYEAQVLKYELITAKQENQQEMARMQGMEQQLSKTELGKYNQSITLLKIALYEDNYTKVKIKMQNYSQYKRDGIPWYSPPFYSHPRGYKLCLRVDAKGNADANGTHTSVFIYLMRGTYDDNLGWPFQRFFKILLTNRKGDDKTCGTLRFLIADSPATPRVTETERNRHGLGFRKFISHNKLHTNNYIKNDSLNFEIIIYN